MQRYLRALSASLAIETRMRDASHSLIRLHESNINLDAVKATTGQLHATTRKMDQIVEKSLRSSERLLAIERLLLQHEGAVLNAGMRRLDAENRELSRTVIELETARDQEKEEKLKWKKEHSHLRIQSMIFPSPPGLEELQGYGNASEVSPAQNSYEQLLRNRPLGTPPSLPSPAMSKIQQEQQLLSLENYMRELNEEILKKDERVIDLEGLLRMVKLWTEEFSASVQRKLGVDNSVRRSESPSSLALMKQLEQLQSQIENGFRALEANAHEHKLKAEEAELAKDKALEFTAMTLANSSAVVTQPQRYLNNGRLSSESNDGSASRRNRTRDYHNDNSHSHQDSRPRGLNVIRSKANTNNDLPHTLHKNHSDLNLVLNESLLELDLQIAREMDNQHPSHHHHNRDHHPNNASSSNLHRNNPTHPGGRNGAGQRGADPSSSNEQLVIGDANVEIKRLNSMVDELERLLMEKMMK